MRVELEDGAYALLLHPKKIPHGKTLAYRRTFYRMAEVGSRGGGDEESVGRAMLENGGLEVMDDLANALVLAIVSEWSFGPVDLETLLTVPTSDLDEIQKHCATDEYTNVLTPDFGVDTDPESPTKPSDS